MIDNKWGHGKVKLVLPITLPSVFLVSSGIKPVCCILDQRVGPEIILLITEPRKLATEFEGRDITGFFVKSGLVNTSYGPVYWILFYFPSPANGQKVTYENVVNPKDEEQVSIYRQLAEQKYWHVVIADDQGEVINFFEFTNHYGLSDALKKLQQVCSELHVSDFMAAKAEYQTTHSVDELLEI
jgi:hypothetical protein